MDRRVIPFPHQDSGAVYLASRDRAGCFDEMGTGKTGTAVTAINYILGRRGVIICPAILRENWIKELTNFLLYPLRLCKGQCHADLKAWLTEVFDVLVMSYELAAKWWPEFRRSNQVLDFLVIDEGHYLKNVDTKRSKAILGFQANGEHGWIARATQAWWLTGTPMPNDPQDIYTFLRFVRAMPLTPANFIGRYFETKTTQYGMKATIREGSALEIKTLVDNNSIRRTMKSIGLHLPSIFLTETLIDGDTDAIKTMIRQYPGLEKAIVDAVGQGGLSFLDAQHVTTLRRLIGEAKAVPYGHMLAEELVCTGAKKVIFGIHIQALTTVADILRKSGIVCVHIQGKSSESVRQQAILAFQNDPKVQVFISNMKVGGTGTTLTAACETDIFEPDWSPGNNAQGLKRVHRIGQERTVHARFVSLADTFDVTVNHIVACKTAEIARVEGFRMIGPIRPTGAKNLLP